LKITKKKHEFNKISNIIKADHHDLNVVDGCDYKFNKEDKGVWHYLKEIYKAWTDACFSYKILLSA